MLYPGRAPLYCEPCAKQIEREKTRERVATWRKSHAPKQESESTMKKILVLTDLQTQLLTKLVGMQLGYLSAVQRHETEQADYDALQAVAKQLAQSDAKDERISQCVDFAIEQYYHAQSVLPIDQKPDVLFEWMRANGADISREAFDSQWQNMTICADCGHVTGYIPGC